MEYPGTHLFLRILEYDFDHERFGDSPCPANVYNYLDEIRVDIIGWLPLPEGLALGFRHALAATSGKVHIPSDERRFTGNTESHPTIRATVRLITLQLPLPRLPALILNYRS